MISVYLLDDDHSTRTVLRLRLELEADISVTGESNTGSEALANLDALGPDVVILDIKTPILDEKSANALVGRIASHCTVIVLSLYDDPNTRAYARDAGAFAMVSKHFPDEHLIAVVRSAASRPSFPSTSPH